MNEKCKCGHEEDNHYLGTEGCAICYKVDKYLCTKYKPMNETIEEPVCEHGINWWNVCEICRPNLKPLNHIPDVGQKEETKEVDDFDTLLRDITLVGFMVKSEARERMNKILDKARQEILVEILAKAEIEYQKANDDNFRGGIAHVINIIKKKKR